MTYDELDVAHQIATLLDRSDTGVPLTPQQVGLLDQYHAGGVTAVDKLIPSLRLSFGDLVIDVGSGFGGPARRIAEQTDASVVGIDITLAYVDAAETLTSRMGLEDRVRFQHANIMELRADRMMDVCVERPFDAAVTMHVQMNVEDKTGWFAAIAGVLRPGGRLAVWEVCTNSGQQPRWPMPWSLDGTDSYLSTPDELRQAITSGGFDTVEWQDETAWVNEWSAATLPADASSLGLAPPMIIDEGVNRVTNFAAALRDETLCVIRGAFVRR